MVFSALGCRYWPLGLVVISVITLGIIEIRLLIRERFIMAENESTLTAASKSGFSGLSGDFMRTYKFFYGFLLLGIVFVLIDEWYNHPLAALLWSFACLACG